MQRNQGITRSHYLPGDAIFRQGEIARNFFIIVNGEVQIFREEGEEIEEIAVRKKGEHFGEMALLRGGLRTATARAITMNPLFQDVQKLDILFRYRIAFFFAAA